MKLDSDLLDDLVERILQVVKPERIVLFGSAARGSMGPNSDIDLLVIVPNGTPRRKTAKAIYRNTIGFGFAKDIIVATQNDIANHGANPYLVYHDALSQGKELYHAAY